MKSLFLSFAALTLSVSAHAAASPLAGSCHANVLNDQGTIIRQSDVQLSPVDPSNHYGLALEGNVEGARVLVELNVGRFDHIGEGKNDKIMMVISSEAGTSSSSISGRALVQGDDVNADLIAGRVEIDCTAKLAR
jgi:hypothetical protein